MKKVETELDRIRARRAAEENQSAEAQKEQARIDLLTADVFETPRGKEWLALNEEILLQRITSPEISDGALRGLEHTRNFLRTIKGRIARFHEQRGTSKG